MCIRQIAESIGSRPGATPSPLSFLSHRCIVDGRQTHECKSRNTKHDNKESLAHRICFRGQPCFCFHVLPSPLSRACCLASNSHTKHSTPPTVDLDASLLVP